MSAPTPPPPYSPPPGMAPSSGSNISFNIKNWNIFDYIALGAGALFFIFSLMDGFVHGSYHGISGGSHFTAWHSWGFLGVLLVLAAVALVALKAVSGLIPPSLPLPLPLIIGGVAGFGWLLLALRSFTYSASSFGTCNFDGMNLCSGVSVSPGWSAWLVLVIGLVIIAAVVIPLTGIAGDVEAKLNSAVNQVGNQMGGHNNGGNNFPPPPTN